MILPDCPTPRPGESVAYYRSHAYFEGVFHGYNTDDQLLIRNSAGGITQVDNFMQIRLLKPTERVEGCWINLPKNAAVQDASLDERRILDALLDRRIAPGPKYIEFITEIWARGYEVFLVGGSVRDALNGDTPNDVDLVTTMPFFYLESVVDAMFGTYGYSRHAQNGFMSVGMNASKGSSKEINIDVKNFFTHAPGTPDAEFGADLTLDQRLRDFACNAVYYDPINLTFIDPCGSGISDAKGKLLNIVNDVSISHPLYRKAHIAMRFFKFVHRGYTPTDECIDKLRDDFKPLLEAIGSSGVQSLFYRSILGKTDKADQAEVFWNSKQLMKKYGFEDTWNVYLSDMERRYGGKK